MIDDAAIICRCEDVTWGEIRVQIEKGWTTVEEIKRLTRAGMGRCQGTTCRNMIVKELARVCQRAVGEMDGAVFRPPLIPVQTGIYAGVADHENR
jgi:bacterioferritin-associated ferredoxin